MSIETWVKEFLHMDGPADTALDRSILKWRGLLKTNLKKHGLKFSVTSYNGCILEKRTRNFLPIVWDDTCPLCQQYAGNGCDGCPLSESGQNCSFGDSPWMLVIRSGDPRTMLNALKECKKKKAVAVNTKTSRKKGAYHG